jgi:tetratricopeptide (TPR) repeat protein
MRGHVAKGRSAARRRRREAPLFVPALLAIACLATLAFTIPFSGVHIPGSRRIHALLDRLPQPWKPPRPVYVLPPESEAAPLVIAVAQTGETPPEAMTVAAPVASAAEAPAVPAEPVEPSISPPAPAAAPAASVRPAPPAFRLEGFRHQWQTWNNCGPATITMATSHFGRPETQAQAARFLKPNADDKNVGPDELVAYTRSLGLRADWLVAGDLERLKLLLANGIPVVAEMWFTPQPNDGMGHYRLLVGYDDAAGRFYAYDSYSPPGVNVPLPYRAFDADWRVFNRTYIPVYPAERADVVAAIVGPDADHQAMYARALAVAQQEAAAQPGDAFAWFNLGTSLTALGRTAEAVAAFDRARSLRLPWRMLWYQFAPFEAYLAEGRINDVLALADANLRQTGDLEESHYYRGRALQALGQTAAARAAFQNAVRVNPRFAPAHHALASLA